MWGSASDEKKQHVYPDTNELFVRSLCGRRTVIREKVTSSKKPRCGICQRKLDKIERMGANNAED